MKLDTKTVRLSDGTELQIQWTWAAALRLRKATGIDMAKADLDEAAQRTKSEALLENLAVVLHSMLSKADRLKYAPEDLGDRIAFLDVFAVSTQLFEAMRPDAEEKEEVVPFVNGAAADHSVLNASTLSGDVN